MESQGKFFTVQLNSRPVKRIELYTRGNEEQVHFQLYWI